MERADGQALSPGPTASAGMRPPAAGDLERLAGWIGRAEARDDTLGAAPIVALSALLDRDDPPPRAGDATPAARPLALLPADASAVRSWGPTATARAASSCRRCRCRGACGPEAASSSCARSRSAQAARRVSRIADVTVKEGRSGTLVFVTVRHEVSDARRPRDRRRARHRLPRRDAGRPCADPVPAPSGEAWSREIRPGPGAALPLLGGHLQRPPHPLRPALRHAGRGLSGARGARPAGRHAARGPAAARAGRASTSRASRSARCGRSSTRRRSACAACPTTARDRRGSGRATPTGAVTMEATATWR